MEHAFESEQPTILVVGHGTRSIAGADEFNRLAKHLRDVFPRRDCAIGFLEFARPTIEEGLRELISRGVRRITAVPGMLMAAGHAKNDIPSELNEFQAGNSRVMNRARGADGAVRLSQ